MSSSNAAVPAVSFRVARGDFTRTDWSEQQLSCGAGQLLLRIDQFAFTANNITYAAYGDALGYWQFYPQPDGWGQIPVWGFANVIASQVDGVAVGERLFGYWPMADHALLTPNKVDALTVTEGAATRQALNPFYNRYTRCASDPVHREDQEPWLSLFRPLGLTAFLMDAWLAQHAFWGANTVVLSSASSKTAMGVAHFLSQREGVQVVGLTSARNRDFVESLGCYHRTVVYDDIAHLDAQRPSLFIDLSGDAAVQRAAHVQLGTQLQRSITVGGTHWREIRMDQAPPGPAPEFFFAPDHILRRLSEWGPEGFMQRFAIAWASLMPRVQGAVHLEHGQGRDAVERVYRAFIEGSAAATTGYILRL